MNLRVITNPLGGSALTQAFSNRTAPVDWYPNVPPGGFTDEFWKDRVHSVASDFAGQSWVEALDGAFGHVDGSVAKARMDGAAKRGVVVTTGQQPGLFGGPLYTLSKALTALAMANRIEKMTGVPAAPVFWAATDDADFAESSTVIVPASDSALQLAIEKIDPVQRPLADESLPDVSAALGDFLRGVGSSSNSALISLLSESYAPGRTVGEAYVTLLRGIFEPLGISVLDASHPSVRNAGHPVMMQALAKAADVARSLSERAQSIRQAGYKPQVREVAGRSVVFRYSAEGKERITVAHASRDAGSAKPGDLSATVLLRPIMERAILPTVAYVGGPAEVAYFAQVSAVAEAIGAKQPVVIPRWSGTLIESRVEKILERYSLSPADFLDPHALEGTYARKAVPSGIQSLIEKLKDAVSGVVSSQLANVPAGLLPDSALEGLRRDLVHKLDRFERRAAAAVKREGTAELRDIRAARDALFPFGKPQERAVSFVALLARYGNDLLDKMLEAAAQHMAESA